MNEEIQKFVEQAIALIAEQVSSTFVEAIATTQAGARNQAKSPSKSPLFTPQAWLSAESPQ